MFLFNVLLRSVWHWELYHIRKPENPWEPVTPVLFTKFDVISRDSLFSARCSCETAPKANKSFLKSLFSDYFVEIFWFSIGTIHDNFYSESDAKRKEDIDRKINANQKWFSENHWFHFLKLIISGFRRTSLRTEDAIQIVLTSLEY